MKLKGRRNTKSCSRDLRVKIQRNVPSSLKLSQARESFQVLLEDSSRSQLHPYQPSEGKKRLPEKEQKSILHTKIATEKNLESSKVRTKKKTKKMYRPSPNKIQINFLIT